MSLKTVEDPEIEGILLTQCTRISGSIRETFRPGGYFKSIPIMGQRDLTIQWAVGAGKAKLPLIEKGLIADDGGGFFGWGVENGHLGKTEIFCKFSPMNPEAWKGVDGWFDEQSDAGSRREVLRAHHVAAGRDRQADRSGSVELPRLVEQDRWTSSIPTE